MHQKQRRRNPRDELFASQLPHQNKHQQPVDNVQQYIRGVIPAGIHAP